MPICHDVSDGMERGSHRVEVASCGKHACHAASGRARRTRRYEAPVESAQQGVNLVSRLRECGVDAVAHVTEYARHVAGVNEHIGGDALDTCAVEVSLVEALVEIVRHSFQPFDYIARTANWLAVFRELDSRLRGNDGLGIGG